jgi:formamidopyrimidine-DNA glycosylase
MRGQLLVEDKEITPGKYHCVTLGLEDGRDLRFYDMWTWGEMRALTNDELDALPNLARMGREPLEANWGASDLAQTLAGRKTPIKPALLDQRVLAGVGNIYADEALFRAGIHPERPAESLVGPELDRLASAVRTVLSEAVNGGGTTSENYVDVRGVAGRYTPRVYDRGGQPCPACGTALLRIRLGGRGTVFCGNCQA